MAEPTTDLAASPTRPSVRGRAVRLGASLVGVALIMTVLAGTRFMERMFFYPSRQPFPTPVGIEDVRFETSDGLTLHAWFAPARGVAAGERAPTVLHVHGNAGNVSSHWWFSEFLVHEGFNVLCFDYRSFGRSDRAARGMRREHAILDAHAALDHLLTRDDVDPDRIGVYGISLGASIALAMASEREEVRAVVAGAGFSGWRDIANEKIPLLGAALIQRGADATDSVRALGDRPLLIVHGTPDAIVPVHHAERIAGAARDAGVRVEVVTSDIVGHNDLVDDPALRDAVAGFFRRELAPR